MRNVYSLTKYFLIGYKNTLLIEYKIKEQPYKCEQRYVKKITNTKLILKNPVKHIVSY